MPTSKTFTLTENNCNDANTIADLLDFPFKSKF
jgi:hypothetical protein